MEKTEYGLIGSMVKDAKTGLEYRIYCADGGYVYAAEIDTNKLKILKIGSDRLFGERFSILPDDTDLIVDESVMTDAQKQEFRQRSEYIRTLEDMFGPTFEGIKDMSSSAVVNGAFLKYGFSAAKGWRLIRRYLQSGCSMASLVDQRSRREEHKEYEYTKKTGRPRIDRFGEPAPARGVVLTTDVLSHFEEFRKLHLKKQFKSYMKAYDDMMKKYYKGNAEKGLKAQSERPTYDQFYHYCVTRNTCEAVDKKKLGANKQRNNKRLLLNSVRKGVVRPGQMVELDALESGVSIIDDDGQVLGDAITYAAVDVYTGAIFAVTAGYNNNSNLGLSALFMNIVDDKRELLKSVGLELDGDIPWPGNFIPEAVRCDNGSDFTSQQFEAVLERLGIDVEHVPPAMGSLKPLVEHAFLLYQNTYRDDLTKHGLRLKDQLTKPENKACMTLYDYKRLLFSFVLFHNAFPNMGYKRSPEMVKKHIGTDPMSLWKFGTESAGDVRKLRTPAQKTQFLYDLLVEDTASYTKQGLLYQNLYYTTDDEDMRRKFYDAQKKSVLFTIRYDPRSVDELYYQENGRIKAFKLNPGKNNNIDYSGMTWFQYLTIRREELDLKAEEKEKKQDLAIAESMVQSQIIAEAKARNKALKTGNIRDARSAEKQADNYENRISENPQFDYDAPAQPLAHQAAPALAPPEDGQSCYEPYDDPNDIFE